MIKVQNRKQKKLLTVVALVLTFAVLLAVALVLNAVLNSSSPEGPGEKELPELREGEALYNNAAVAYEHVSEDEISMVYIRNAESAYSLVRNEKGYFVLYYADENGNMKVYYPDVCVEDTSFDYQSLYAIEQGDGYDRIPKLTYLCTALGVPYFEERIDLPEDADERYEVLSDFGLDPAQAAVASFTFKRTATDGTETEEVHTVSIGQKSVTGSGHYFMVDDRMTIYSTANNYFDYALKDFSAYIQPALVSAGLPTDSSFEPYLTTDFSEWKNTVHGEEGETVPEGAKVVVDLNAYTVFDPKTASETRTPPADGYESTGFSPDEIDLAGQDTAARERLRAILVGKKVGKFDTPFYMTLSDASREIDFSEKESIEYVYRIFAIEAILDASGETRTAGASVGSAEKILVSFDLLIDGVQKNGVPMHGVLDLTDPALDAGTVSTLRSGAVGNIETVPLSVTYTKTTAMERTVRAELTAIVAISDGEGKDAATVSDGCYVTYRYRLYVDGAPYGEEDSVTVCIGKGESEEEIAAATVLMGREKGKNLSEPLWTHTEYCERMLDFTTYEVREISYFVVPEKIVSFRFQNASERDPFFGESFYVNTMENRYRLYGLNAASCEAVVKSLGGIGNSTTSSDGLFGSKTLAVGLTPDVMKQYGLYAYTVHFELPRGISEMAISSPDELEELSDYVWRDTLGFTLYVSEEKVDADGSYYRYAGSDLYDVVVKIGSEPFEFLKYGFVDFYARRNIALMDIADVGGVDISLKMDDVFGDYNFELSHSNIFIDANGKPYPTRPEDVSTVAWDAIDVIVTTSGETSGSALDDYLAEKGYDFVSLRQFYQYVACGGTLVMEGNDPLGTANFKEIMELIYYTYYAGTVPEAEQEALIASSPEIMRMKIRLVDGAVDYVYEFYRTDDCRVAVRIYKANGAGTVLSTPVQDFYISTFAYKKIVSAFLDLLDAKSIDNDTGYRD